MRRQSDSGSGADMKRQDVMQMVLTVAVVVAGLSSALSIVEATKRSVVERKRADLIRRRVEISLPPQGHRLNSIRVHDLRGKGLDIKLDDGSGQSSLLIVYSPFCPACDASWPFWNQATSEVSAVRVFALSTTGPTTTPPSFFQRHNVQDRIVRLALAPQSLVDLQTRATPQTIVVDDSGRVVKAWLGALSAAAVPALRNALTGEGPNAR